MTDDDQSQARVAAALKLLGTMRGGAMPSLDEIAGLTPEERHRAESLFAADLQMSAPMDDARMRMLVYLVKNTPADLPVPEQIRALSPEQLDELNRLGEVD
jgi:hypothetical protein